MEEKLAVEGIYQRNEHRNPFQLKVPSHNATQHSLQNMSTSFTLNKIALLPFITDLTLTSLYRQALENLTVLPPVHFKNQQFVDNLTDHLVNWEQQMHLFGTWPYTRAALYSIQQKIKNNRSLWEKVVLKRALLEPNKQEFLNRTAGLTFSNIDLMQLVDSLRVEQTVQMVQEHRCQLPRDILTYDGDECWRALEARRGQLDPEGVQDCLQEYLRSGLSRFGRSKIECSSVSKVIESISLRRQVYSKFLAVGVEQFDLLLQRLNSDNNHLDEC